MTTVFRPAMQGDTDAVLRCARIFRRVLSRRIDFARAFCPTGNDGGIDNSCGSGSGGGGGAFSSAPTGSKGAAKWRKEAAKEYKSNPEFRAVADAAAMFTQGYYVEIRDAILSEKGELKGSSTIKMDEPLSSLHTGLYEIKDFIEGQDLANSTELSIRSAAMALDSAVSNAPATTAPIYRGLELQLDPAFSNDQEQTFAKWVGSVKEGDSVDFAAPVSFSANKQQAEKFATGTSSGQGSNREEGRGVVIEVVSGAKALPVAALSPWKSQEEMLSSGSFSVVSVTGQRPEQSTYAGDANRWGWPRGSGQGTRVVIQVQQTTGGGK